jgi:hypothetical protein
MQRPISTKAHGAIDYAWATAAATLSQKMKGGQATARLLQNAGLMASMNSTVTNYEAGVVKVVPMKGHLACDLVIGTVLMAAPLFLPASERRWAAIPVAFGIVAVLAGLLTETRSPSQLGTVGPFNELGVA